MNLVDQILEGKTISEAIEATTLNESASFDTFIKFITGTGSILVTDEKSFDRFIAMLKDHKVTEILPKRGNSSSFSWWQNIAEINGNSGDLFVFEYQPGKGLSWYSDVETPTDWYGEAPMKI